MQKWARMPVKTGKASVDPSAMLTQMREDSRLLEFATFNDLVLAKAKHPEDGSGITQMDNTTTRLITFQRERASDQECTLTEDEVFQEQTLKVTTTC